MADLISEISQLRGQGLTDNLILDELTKQGYNPQEVEQAITQADSFQGNGAGFDFSGGQPAFPQPQMSSQANDGSNGRMEEIIEGIIDEKWDDLIKEVKKIIEWKEKVEQKQVKMATELTKLKEDFTLLHQGVLGKLETYDERMRDVGTELKAVGKVFKEVVPEFVENVKELSHITGKKKAR